MKTAHDLVEAARAEIREIPLDQADDAIKKADVLLDVREADEYNTSHIPGAVNVSRGILEFKLTNDPAFEDRALNLVIYCKNSGRSALAARAMKEMGYIHVQSIAGGIEAWEAAGKPLVKPELPSFD
ncbi:sulfurtransferase [Marinobacter sp. ES-1]|jgi:rhodanese-related sulfurtransferase|uniref:rhodanese-like domain-containing protein n=1 Tax=unclassified Marinobacter TaxID=83889 RepID=UPI0003B91371|nr:MULTISPECIES: rhodanese-like domain-containing protein [unclassified Marinobacter]ERP93444.1 sulfurtransferase [Marinobacter sp. ES-1]MCE0759602.1 sulfurtransferase [Marinobacter sp. G11]|tara:strand:- start:643 stop:1023 length:381 start_codon:yes stop_codon:yes gene_type:complete